MVSGARTEGTRSLYARNNLENECSRLVYFMLSLILDKICGSPDAPDDPTRGHISIGSETRRLPGRATGDRAPTPAETERCAHFPATGEPPPESSGFAPSRPISGSGWLPHAGANGATPGRSRARAPGGPFGISNSPIFGLSSKSSQCGSGGATFGVKFGSTIFQRPTFGSDSGSSDQVRKNQIFS